jgi:peptidoglycan/xylan/chitin deacetylase (PgdA/CDA1 family)
MYHYVRPIVGSKHPRIRGLEVEAFVRQLDYLSNNYIIMDPREVISLAHHRKPLPPKACLLTFDDGYIDHYKYVLPVLIDKKLKGIFFPPASAVLNGDLLQVNAIHFLLDACSDSAILLEDIRKLFKYYSISDIEFSRLWTEFGIPSRYDNADVVFIKRILQTGLPQEISYEFVNILFEKYLGCRRDVFAKDLYMNVGQVKELISAGMLLGGHGYKHIWLNRESKSKQEEEIDGTLTFLDQMGETIDGWVMCYPYGGYNADTLSILMKKNCLIAFTTNPGTSSFNSENFLTLNRLDTNDFPQ